MFYQVPYLSRGVRRLVRISRGKLGNTNTPPFYLISCFVRSRADARESRGARRPPKLPIWNISYDILYDQNAKPTVEFVCRAGDNGPDTLVVYTPRVDAGSPHDMVACFLGWGQPTQALICRKAASERDTFTHREARQLENCFDHSYVHIMCMSSKAQAAWGDKKSRSGSPPKWRYLCCFSTS